MGCDIATKNALKANFFIFLLKNIALCYNCAIIRLIYGGMSPRSYILIPKLFKISSKNSTSLSGLIPLIAKSSFSKTTFALSLGKPFCCIFNRFSLWKARFLIFFASCNSMRDFCHLLKGLLLVLSKLNWQYFWKKGYLKNFYQKQSILFCNI